MASERQTELILRVAESAARALSFGSYMVLSKRASLPFYHGFYEAVRKQDLRDKYDTTIQQKNRRRASKIRQMHCPALRDGRHCRTLIARFLPRAARRRFECRARASPKKTIRLPVFFTKEEETKLSVSLGTSYTPSSEHVSGSSGLYTKNPPL